LYRDWIDRAEISLIMLIKFPNYLPSLLSYPNLVGVGDWAGQSGGFGEPAAGSSVGGGFYCGQSGEACLAPTSLGFGNHLGWAEELQGNVHGDSSHLCFSQDCSE